MDVPLHSKIKHLIIGYYFGALEKFIPRWYSFNYVDLYAGDGSCELREKIPRHIELPKDFLTEWRPPFFKLLDFIASNRILDREYNFFFNDTNADSIKKLTKAVEPYKSSVRIVVENEDANMCVQEAIKFVGTPASPSIFYLDPCNHEELKFSTIEEIASFTNAKNGRKPELIVNLMVYSMLQGIQRGREVDFDSISNSLGTDKWKNELELYRQNQLTHELFLKVFIERMQKIGYYCTPCSVRSIKCNAPQYYIIFCTFDEKKIHPIHKNIEKSIRKLQEEKWVKETHVVEWMSSHIPKEQKPLASYFKAQ